MYNAITVPIKLFVLNYSNSLPFLYKFLVRTKHYEVLNWSLFWQACIFSIERALVFVLHL